MKTLIVSFFTFFIVTAFATETNIYDWKSDKFTLQLELNIGSCYNLDRILWQYEGITKTIPKVFEASPLFERLNHVQISIWREYFNQDSLSGKFEFKGNDTLEITLFGEPLLHEIIKFLNFIEFNETIERHRNKEIWELKGNKYKLKFDIF